MVIYNRAAILRWVLFFFFCTATNNKDPREQTRSHNEYFITFIITDVLESNLELLLRY